MNLLNAESISVRMGTSALLSGVSVSVAAGRITAIVGPNGAGKSTLLKCLSGAITPNSGRVTLDQRDICLATPVQYAKQIAVLPQQSSLNFCFAVQDVVQLGRHPHASGVKKDRQVVAEVMAATDTCYLKDRDYTTLSGGEKQRVQLARVIAQIWQAQPLGSRFLLLDEPTSALDISHQHLILNCAQRMAKQGVGVAVILHDLNLAAQYANNIIMLKNGKTVIFGETSKVLSAENITEVFDCPAMVIPHPVSGRPAIFYNE